MYRADRRKAGMFFSEEKNQKTFNSSALPNSPAMSRISPRDQKQKSFGSFLQKRTSFLLLDFY
jgi:hypothetical protein